MSITHAYRITGPEGNGVILTVEETVEGDQVVLSVTREGSATQTIRLDEASWDELTDLRYKIKLEKAEAPPV